MILKRRHVYTTALFLLPLLTVMYGCAPKVLAPPRMDLKNYGRVGIYAFEGNAKGKLNQLATQKLIETIQYYQPGTPIIELGSSQGNMDPQQLQALKETRGIDVVIGGELKVSDVKPRLNIGAILSSISIEANIDATMLVKLYETQGGATIWTRSGRANQNVGQISFSKISGPSFEASDPEAAYGSLVQHLINQVTDDFASHWVKGK